MEQKSSVNMRGIREAYQKEIEKHYEKNKVSALAVTEYLEHSSAAYHGRCVQTLHIPKILTEEAAA